ncbi:hypothetical protein PVAP13_9KG227985 [Panicum virgatum]|uniref:Uncharacterized protein n=1 Tax=Panicum virgatum TaxID=38727 RepID=A0A8T0NKA1_PANVG|nr:hypothetical protein PVAP13_9KG227985 [Panicum virgatum]
MAMMATWAVSAFVSPRVQLPCTTLRRDGRGLFIEV